MVSRLLRAVTESASANERFKAGWGRRVAVGVVAAVAAHAGLFLAFPTLHADDLGAAGDPADVINVPPEAYIPPPPDEVVRPAAPRVGDVDVDDARTIPIPEWDRNPPRAPSPPSVRGEEGAIVTSYEVASRLENDDEVARALEREYPSALRRAGVGGRVVLWIHVDETGRVADTRVQRSSGQPALDAAAREVARTMRFSPAFNMDRPTPVWVQQSILFEVR